MGDAPRRILRNGLVNGQAPGFVAWVGDRIVAVGDETDADGWIRPGDEVGDAEGAWIVPAFTDSHIHVFGMAAGRHLVDLHGSRSMEELGRRLLEGAPEGDGWIQGTGWDETLLGGLPDRTVLDRLFPDRPVYIARRCLHIAAANTRAFERAGVALDARPDHGEADRGPDGRMTGILREGAAGPISRAIPDPTLAERAARVGQVLDDLAGYGIASVSTNDGLGEGIAPWEIYQALLSPDRERPPRPEVFWDAPLAALDAVRAAGLHSYDDSHPEAEHVGFPGLRMGAVKFVTDGSLGGRTAYMLRPYVRETGEAADHRGLLRMTPQDLVDGIRACTEAGLRVCLHAIGDGTAHAVLDALETVGKAMRVRRPRIIHSQFVTEQDRARYRELRVIADVQPLFAVSDRGLLARVPEAAASGYAWRRFLEVGVHLAMGSDAPVESPNPLLGVRAARFRGGRLDEVPGWDGERLDLGTVLRLYSEGGAYAQGAGKRRGRLIPGARADLVAVRADRFGVADAADPQAYEDGPGIRPDLTVLRGHPVQADAFRRVGRPLARRV